MLAGRQKVILQMQKTFHAQDIGQPVAKLKQTPFGMFWSIKNGQLSYSRQGLKHACSGQSSLGEGEEQKEATPRGFLEDISSVGGQRDYHPGHWGLRRGVKLSAAKYTKAKYSQLSLLRFVKRE